MTQRMPLSILLCLVFFIPFLISDRLMQGLSSTKIFGFHTIILSLCVYYAIYWIFQPRSIVFSINIIDLLVVCWWLSALLNISLFPVPLLLNTSFLTFSGLVILYFIIRAINQHEPLKLTLVLCALLAGIGQVAYGLLQLGGCLPIYHSTSLLTGTFFNSGPYAGFLVPTFILALGVFLLMSSSSRSKYGHVPPFLKKTIWYTAIVFIIGTMLILPFTQSRAAWAAALGGSVIILSFYPNIRKRLTAFNTNIKKIAIILTLLISLCTVFSLLFYLKPDSASGRLLIWQVTLRMILDNLILGVGIGNYKGSFGSYQVAFFENNPDSPLAPLAGEGEYAFNIFLEIAAEQGLLGLSLFITIIILALRRCSSSTDEIKLVAIEYYHLY